MVVHIRLVVVRARDKDDAADVVHRTDPSERAGKIFERSLGVQRTRQLENVTRFAAFDLSIRKLRANHARLLLSA